jgi:hypothetical protein
MAQSLHRPAFAATSGEMQERTALQGTNHTLTQAIATTADHGSVVVETNGPKGEHTAIGTLTARRSLVVTLAVRLTSPR